MWIFKRFEVKLYYFSFYPHPKKSKFLGSYRTLQVITIGSHWNRWTNSMTFARISVGKNFTSIPLINRHLSSLFRFCICQFAHLLTFICNSKISTSNAFVVILDKPEWQGIWVTRRESFSWGPTRGRAAGLFHFS